MAGGRGGTVIDLLFPYGHIPVTVDGYAPYRPGSGVLQRCWTHVLREAKHLCDGDRRLHGLYVSPKEIYHGATRMARTRAAGSCTAAWWPGSPASLASTRRRDAALA